MKDMNQDLISRQSAIDSVCEVCENCEYFKNEKLIQAIKDLPSAQPEPAIPLSWIEGQIEWLKSLDNAFLTLTAGQISAMMNNWKDEQNEGFNQQTGCD